ncbi:MAG: type II secretion system protein [Selenomonadaceae bacterium]|nr:type II secretion system protein [Selenomonadaceae bacterium]
MQKGFATLEIILFTLIIAVLATATLPNAARVIDRVALDYETKKLYSDLRFMQSLERMTYMKNVNFSNLDGTIDETDVMFIDPNYYTLEKTANSKIYYEHYFSSGVTASQNDGKAWTIKFDDAGRISPAISDTLKLTSRFNKNSYIVFDSVGRFRGGREQ